MQGLRILNKNGASLSSEEIEAAHRVANTHGNMKSGTFIVTDRRTGVLVEYYPFKKIAFTSSNNLELYFTVFVDQQHPVTGVFAINDIYSLPNRAVIMNTDGDVLAAQEVNETIYTAPDSGNEWIQPESYFYPNSFNGRNFNTSNPNTGATILETVPIGNDGAKTPSIWRGGDSIHTVSAYAPIPGTWYTGDGTNYRFEMGEPISFEVPENAAAPECSSIEGTEEYPESAPEPPTYLTLSTNGFAYTWEFAYKEVTYTSTLAYSIDGSNEVSTIVRLPYANVFYTEYPINHTTFEPTVFSAKDFQDNFPLQVNGIMEYVVFNGSTESGGDYSLYTPDVYQQWLDAYDEWQVENADYETAKKVWDIDHGGMDCIVGELPWAVTIYSSIDGLTGYSTITSPFGNVISGTEVITITDEFDNTGFITYTDFAWGFVGYPSLTAVKAPINTNYILVNGTYDYDNGALLPPEAFVETENTIGQEIFDTWVTETKAQRQSAIERQRLFQKSCSDETIAMLEAGQVPDNIRVQLKAMHPTSTNAKMPVLFSISKDLVEDAISDFLTVVTSTVTLSFIDKNGDTVSETITGTATIELTVHSYVDQYGNDGEAMSSRTSFNNFMDVDEITGEFLFNYTVFDYTQMNSDFYMDDSYRSQPLLCVIDGYYQDTLDDQLLICPDVDPPVPKAEISISVRTVDTFKQYREMYKPVYGIESLISLDSSLSDKETITLYPVEFISETLGNLGLYPYGDDIQQITGLRLTKGYKFEYSFSDGTFASKGEGALKDSISGEGITEKQFTFVGAYENFASCIVKSSRNPTELTDIDILYKFQKASLKNKYDPDNITVLGLFDYLA